MNSWDLRRHIDLVILFIVEFLFVILYFLRIEIGLITFALGMVHLGFIPGYLLTFILFPKNKKQEPEEEDVEVLEPVDDESDEMNLDQRWRRRRRRLDEEKDVELDEEEKGPRIEREIDWPIRIALSIGLSIGMTAVISWIFNYLYIFDNEVFGLRIDTITIFLFLMNTVFLGFAMKKRNRLTEEESEMIKLDRIKIIEGDRNDKIITSLLIIAIVISIFAGIYLHYFHVKDEETYTELFFLTDRDDIKDIDKLFLMNETHLMKIGVTNNERKNMDFNVRLSLDGVGVARNVDDFFDVSLDHSEILEMDISVNKDKTHKEFISFRIPIQGRFLLQAELYHENEPYRKIYLDVTVVDPENYIQSDDLEVEGYIARELHEPIDMPSSMTGENNLTFGIVLRNTGNISHFYNLTIVTGGIDLWSSAENTSMVYDLHEGLGYFVDVTLEPQKTTFLGFRFSMPLGRWDMRISFSNNGTLGFDRTVIVY